MLTKWWTSSTISLRSFLLRTFHLWGNYIHMKMTEKSEFDNTINDNMDNMINSMMKIMQRRGQVGHHTQNIPQYEVTLWYDTMIWDFDIQLGYDTLIWQNEVALWYDNLRGHFYMTLWSDDMTLGVTLWYTKPEVTLWWVGNLVIDNKMCLEKLNLRVVLFTLLQFYKQNIDWRVVFYQLWPRRLETSQNCKHVRIMINS